MAPRSRERLGEILQAVLSALAEAPAGLTIGEVTSAIEGRLTLTGYEESPLPSNPNLRQFDDIVRRSATIAAVKAGWFNRQHGWWTITEDGRRALGAMPNPYDLIQRAVVLYNARMQQK